MANSKYEYVREFESDDSLLRNTWIVVRIDGRAFHKLTTKYGFAKPNDRRGLDLMNAAGVALMKELSDLVLGFGASDEYSFIFHKDTRLFGRRSSKLLSTIVSTFTAYYIAFFNDHFPDVRLTSPMPTFDGRCICYPTVGNLRDYISWRQADVHINNLYNTTFWSLVLTNGLSNVDAEQKLKGSVSSDKNELLFQNGINYNMEPEIYRKGSILYWDYELAEALEGSANILESVVSDTEEIPSREEILAKESAHKLSKSAQDRERKTRDKAGIKIDHCDVINNDFWQRRPWILSGRAGKLKNRPALSMRPGEGNAANESSVEGYSQRYANGEQYVGVEVK